GAVTSKGSAFDAVPLTVTAPFTAPAARPGGTNVKTTVSVKKACVALVAPKETKLFAPAPPGAPNGPGPPKPPNGPGPKCPKPPGPGPPGPAKWPKRFAK